MTETTDTAAPDSTIEITGIPGHRGAVGPFADEYKAPHMYARDIYSGSAPCVCGHPVGHRLHTDAAPGVPIPESERYE